MTTVPAPQSFPLYSGSRHELNFTVTDKSGTVVDLTGGSGRFAMARSLGGTIIVDSDASPAEATITVTDAVNGLLTVELEAAITEPLVGDYYWELKWTSSVGRPSVTARGVITVLENLT